MTKSKQLYLVKYTGSESQDYLLNNYGTERAGTYVFSRGEALRRVTSFRAYNRFNPNADVEMIPYHEGDQINRGTLA